MTASRTLAIFPWGEVIEAFLDPLGLTVEDFAARMRGGWLFGYVAALARQGWSCTIVCASEAVAEPRRLIHEETGAAIWCVPGRRTGEGFTRARPSLQALQQWRRTPWRTFARILRLEGCSAVLVQDYEHARFDALALLGRRLRIPVFATFQGGDVTLSPLEARVRRLSLAICRGLIVPSARERERLRRVYGAAAPPVADIPNPLDAGLWRPHDREQARASLGIAPAAFLAINHGRIDIHRKGLDILVEAWRRVTAQRADAQLVVIGSGQDHARFGEMVRDVPNLSWRTNYVTDPGLLRRWLSGADLYVTLSRTEGMPVAPLEAMACGLPLLASDTHGLADLLSGGASAGGLLVPCNDAAAAADAIELLAADPGLRQRLGRAARRTVETHYALDAVGAQLAELLEAGSRAAAPAVRAAPPNPAMIPAGSPPS